MLLREAMTFNRTTPIDSRRRVGVVASFELLHLTTYLQAFLAQRSPTGAPRVVTFGYDQLQEGLSQTAQALRAAPAVLCLSWEDVHPALAWRSRAVLGEVTVEAVQEQAQALEQRLVAWLTARLGAETCLILPPRDWLAPPDACPPPALGPIAIVAVSNLWRIAQRLTTLGGRVVAIPEGLGSFRDLLQAGCPLSVEGCETVARQVAGLLGTTGGRKKAIVADLDNTLWHGVIGEDGPQGISYGSEGKGYPHFLFQQMLAKLKREGILLAFCSKNNPDEVLPVFDQLGMPLRLSDFAAFRCNWEAKSSNLRAIAEELHIGCEDLVMVEDNEIEALEVTAAVSGVTILRTPVQSQEWQELFLQLQQLCGSWRVSDEDRLRTANLTARPQPAAITASMSGSGSLAHVREARLVLTVNREAFTDPRSLELINKTNQFNLNGERLTTEEWLQWSERPETFCYSASLQDRYGAFGTICVLTGRRDGTVIRLRQFVLSCRAFGRGVEVLVLGILLRDPQWQTLVGPFMGTGRNEPAERFLHRLGVEHAPDGNWKIGRDAIDIAVALAAEETAAQVLVGAVASPGRGFAAVTAGGERRA